ncbi:MAG: amidohydrolase [Proteobacteria bacterium]|nr:amidohydrolase [Pseudomonadota bacterium]
MSQRLLYNGNFLTMDADSSSADSVLTDRGRIKALGSEARCRAAATGAEETNLLGQTVVPGFIDPHGHFPDSGFLALHRVDLSPPPLGSCSKMDHVLERLREKARVTKPGDWVVGAMLNPAELAEKRFPTQDELDTVSRDHPVWLFHVSGHAGVANSIALEFRAVDSTSEDPKGGKFGRDLLTGELDGLCEGMSAMGKMGDSEFQITYEKFLSAFSHAADEYLDHGVTLAQNAWATKKLLGYFGKIANESQQTIDVMVLPAGFLEPRLTAGDLDIPLPKQDSGIFLGPRKLFIDGSFHLQTACLTKPYFRPYNGDPTHRCELSVSHEQMVARIGKLHDLGFQCHIHANGDAAADRALDAIEEVQKANRREDHRHTLIHSQNLREDQLDRMAASGVSVSFFPAHLHFFGDFHSSVTFGPDRVRNMCPTRWAEERGIRFTIHNDAQVTPTRPLHLIWCAVNRQSLSGKVIGKEQAVSPLRALRAHTIDAAWQVFQEHDRGSIEIGKRADFAVLSGNPLIDPANIHKIWVKETIVLGKTCNRSKEK